MNHNVLNDEQQISVRCVEDILLATDGVRFYTLTGMDALRYTPDPAYAVFVVEPNPAHDELRVAIELAPSALRMRVNGTAFAHKRPKSASPEEWIERQCGLIEKLLSRDLEYSHSHMLGMPASATLRSGWRRTWHDIGKTANGGASVIGYTLWFSFIFVRTKTKRYADWFRAQIEADEDDDHSVSNPDADAE